VRGVAPGAPHDGRLDREFGQRLDPGEDGEGEPLADEVTSGSLKVNHQTHQRHQKEEKENQIVNSSSFPFGEFGEFGGLILVRSGIF
jgi:hypothetical protein